MVRERTTRTHLTLAGHTHGGQISLPGVGILKNASKAPLRWTHGLVRERGQYLYVTSGIGTSGVPLRWRVPAEFVVLDVTGPADAAIRSTVGAATGDSVTNAERDELILLSSRLIPACFFLDFSPRHFANHCPPQ